EILDSNKKRTNASPAMRKLAREKGDHVDDLQAQLFKTKDESDQSNKQQTQKMSTPSENSGSSVETKPVERKRMTRRQQTIATNLVQSQHSAAMLTTFNEVDMTKVMDIRKRRKQAFIEKHDINLGFMSFFSKAVVGALKAYPIINSEI